MRLVQKAGGEAIFHAADVSLGTPEYVAYCALYLASDESSWVTGAAFPVDGGFTAQ